MHIAPFLLSLASTKTSAFSVFEQAVLFAGQELAHIDQLLLGDLFDVNCEVANLHDVPLLDLFILKFRDGPHYVVLCRSITGIVIRDTIWQILKELLSVGEPECGEMGALDGKNRGLPVSLRVTGALGAMRLAVGLIIHYAFRVQGDDRGGLLLVLA